MKKAATTTKQRIYEVHMDGLKAPLWPVGTTMKNAILKAVVENINNGGGSEVTLVKTDKQRVYRDVKINVTYKQDNNNNNSHE